VKDYVKDYVKATMYLPMGASNIVNNVKACVGGQLGLGPGPQAWAGRGQDDVGGRRLCSPGLFGYWGVDIRTWAGGARPLGPGKAGAGPAIWGMLEYMKAMLLSIQACGFLPDYPSSRGETSKRG